MNTALNAILSKLTIPHADRYSPHGFRRGAATELKARGPQWSTVATLGAWRPLALLGYVYITPELDRDTSMRLIEKSSIWAIPAPRTRYLHWARRPKLRARLTMGDGAPPL